ncbi:MAG: cyclic nucleotide-binding domain (cNMP-BD) protein [Ramlibacter sp.]|nr:cyclic nucleotide-binding domain (cNMP-BD) protein [Ramlibacter sp.]
METIQNQLIGGLPAKARNHLLAMGESVHLTLSEVLCDAQDRTRYVYFPVDSFISLVAVVQDSPGIEVGMIGSEGMLGAALALGVATNPLRAVVQGRGAAWRIGAPAFRAEFKRSPPLQRAVGRYLYVLMCQHASSAVCLRFHLIGPRLARWLLMSQDRAHSASFHITHEFLAYMLGVRRVGITNAATTLQRQGLIEYQRGEIHVLDRPGLEAAACGCYSAQQKMYADLLG